MLTLHSHNVDSPPSEIAHHRRHTVQLTKIWKTIYYITITYSQLAWKMCVCAGCWRCWVSNVLEYPVISTEFYWLALKLALCRRHHQQQQQQHHWPRTQPYPASSNTYSIFKLRIRFGPCTQRLRAGERPVFPENRNKMEFSFGNDRTCLACVFSYIHPVLRYLFAITQRRR